MQSISQEVGTVHPSVSVVNPEKRHFGLAFLALLQLLLLLRIVTTISAVFTVGKEAIIDVQNYGDAVFVVRPDEALVCGHSVLLHHAVRGFAAFGGFVVRDVHGGGFVAQIFALLEDAVQLLVLFEEQAIITAYIANLDVFWKN